MAQETLEKLFKNGEDWESFRETWLPSLQDPITLESFDALLPPYLLFPSGHSYSAEGAKVNRLCPKARTLTTHAEEHILLKQAAIELKAFYTCLIKAKTEEQALRANYLALPSEIADLQRKILATRLYGEYTRLKEEKEKIQHIWEADTKKIAVLSAQYKKLQEDKEKISLLSHEIELRKKDMQPLEIYLTALQQAHAALQNNIRLFGTGSIKELDVSASPIFPLSQDNVLEQEEKKEEDFTVPSAPPFFLPASPQLTAQLPLPSRILPKPKSVLPVEVEEKMPEEKETFAAFLERKLPTLIDPLSRKKKGRNPKPYENPITVITQPEYAVEGLPKLISYSEANIKNPKGEGYIYRNPRDTSTFLYTTDPVTRKNFPIVIEEGEYAKYVKDHTLRKLIEEVQNLFDTHLCHLFAWEQEITALRNKNAPLEKKCAELHKKLQLLHKTLPREVLLHIPEEQEALEAIYAKIEIQKQENTRHLSILEKNKVEIEGWEKKLAALGPPVEENALRQLEAANIELKNREAELRGSILSLEEECVRLRATQENELQTLLDTLTRTHPAASCIFHTALCLLSEGFTLYRRQYIKKEDVLAQVLNPFSVQHIGDALAALKKSGLLSISKKDRITASLPAQVWACNYARTHQTTAHLPYFLNGLQSTHPDSVLLLYVFAYLAPEAPVQFTWFMQQPFIVTQAPVRKTWHMRRQPLYVLHPEKIKTQFAILEKYGFIQSKGELLHISSAVHLFLQTSRPFPNGSKKNDDEMLEKILGWFHACFDEKVEEMQEQLFSASISQEIEELEKQKRQVLDPFFLPHLKHLLPQQFQTETFNTLSVLTTQWQIHLFYPLEEIVQYDLRCLKMHLQYQKNHEELLLCLSWMELWYLRRHAQRCMIPRQVEFLMQVSHHLQTAGEIIQEGITPSEEILSTLEYDLHTCIQTWKTSMQDTQQQEEKVITLKIYCLYEAIRHFWKKRALHLSIDSSAAKTECEEIVLPLFYAFACLSQDFPIPSIWLMQGELIKAERRQDIENTLSTLEKIGCLHRPSIDTLQLTPSLRKTMLEHICPAGYKEHVEKVGKWLHKLIEDTVHTTLEKKRLDLLVLHLEYLCAGYKREQAQFSPEEYFVLSRSEEKTYRNTLDRFYVRCWATLFSALGRTYLAQKEYEKAALLLSEATEMCKQPPRDKCRAQYHFRSIKDDSSLMGNDSLLLAKLRQSEHNGGLPELPAPPAQHSFLSILQRENKNEEEKADVPPSSHTAYSGSLKHGTAS